MKKNTIVLWRIVFAYMIAIYHFSIQFGLATRLNLSNGWYIATDFFFIVSGYLLYQTFLQKKYTNSFEYIWDRIRKIYPYYLASYLVLIIVRCFFYGVRETLYYASIHFMELFMLQGIGLNEGWTAMNNSLWYVSVLIIASLLIYSLLSINEKLFLTVIAPLVCILSVSVLYSYVGQLNTNMNLIGFIGNGPLLRGLLEMCLGVYAYKLNERFESKMKKRLVSCLGVFAFLFVIICSLFISFSVRDFLYLILLFLGVAIGFLGTESRIVCNRFVNAWSKYTMSIYFVHMIFSDYLFPRIFGATKLSNNVFLLLGIYLVVITVAAIALYELVHLVVNKMLPKGE